jgi:hypothetical protein
VKILQFEEFTSPLGKHKKKYITALHKTVAYIHIFNGYLGNVEALKRSRNVKPYIVYNTTVTHQ